MFAIERQRMIKKILLEHRHVNVSDLSATLTVSEVTVRRDLEKLESDGFLVRTHGGAILKGDSEELPEVQAASDASCSEDALDAIADLAVGTISNNSSIFLDGGPICLEIAKKLTSQKDVIVMTSSLPVALALSSKANIHTIVPGGEITSSATIFDSNISFTLQTMHIETAFIEPAGFSTKGFSVRDYHNRTMIRAVGEICDQAVFLCDPSLYTNIAFYQIGPLNIADCIITSSSIDNAFKEVCLQNHIKLFTAFSM